MIDPDPGVQAEPCDCDPDTAFEPTAPSVVEVLDEMHTCLESIARLSQESAGGLLFLAPTATASKVLARARDLVHKMKES
jgi:hypothetical protein